VKVPEEFIGEGTDKVKFKPRVLFEEPTRFSESPQPQSELTSLLAGDSYRVLVAEDDPINSKIMKKRLEKLGHSVFMTVNGEECSSAFGDRAASFDVVLMDLQVRFLYSCYSYRRS
jgi:PleD family two-component response regulator